MLACQPCVHPYYLPITLFESPCVPRRQAEALVSDIRVTGIRRTEALECMSPSPLPLLTVFHFRPFIPPRCQHFVILSPFLSLLKSDSVISPVHRVPPLNMYLALDSESVAVCKEHMVWSYRKEKRCIYYRKCFT